MAFNPCKKSHNYRFNSKILHHVSRETMDQNGRVGFETEVKDMTSPEFINTPKCDVMDFSTLLATGQPIKRVPTAVLGDVDSVAFAPDVVPPDPDSDPAPLPNE